MNKYTESLIEPHKYMHEQNFLDSCHLINDHLIANVHYDFTLNLHSHNSLRRNSLYTPVFKLDFIKFPVHNSAPNLLYGVTREI